jgi:type IV pilus assembly protein PilV
LNGAQKLARTRGFSLVEVMVAVVVICVGLLGIAKMQSLSLSNMTTSRQRALAAFEAAGLAAAMHVDRDYWTQTLAGFNLTVAANQGAAPAIGSTDAALAAQATADLGNLNACVGTAAGGPACTPVLLAAYDVARWATSLQGLLPNANAVISCPNAAGVGAPPSCTIQITWSETAVAMTTQEAQQQAAVGNTALFQTPTYLLYIEP